ncbi:universal stress protein [Aquiflexum lacus]|uniref:universal stress protein n=1 Tax=Aquiflexum lacus TaxID=2483805 RepID=UPI001894DF56|nr:universal stress protein [Aquiflexum lacus]
MKNFEKAMVGLDLTEMDEILIPKISAVSGILGIQKIYFIHVSKDLSLPEEVKKNFPDLVAPADEAIKSEIKSLLASSNFPKNIEIEIVVEEGNPMSTVLRWAKIKDVDLMIMGRKKVLEGSGSLAKSLAQKAPCSVMFIPELVNIKIPERILVPMDFSAHSHFTFQFAEKAAEEFNSTIFGLHLYEVPSGYYKTGKSFDEFAEIMKSHAKNDYEKFLEKYAHNPFECMFVLNDSGNEGRFIIDKANELNIDLILMGSRGRTSSAAVLLGSIAEKLVQANNEVPMLIFKKKGETMSFFDALMKI